MREERRTHPRLCGHSFADLREAAADAAYLPAKRVAVVADSNVEHLCVALRGEAATRGIGIDILNCGSELIDRVVFTSDSRLHEFAPEITVLWFSFPYLAREFNHMSASERNQFAERHGERFESLVDVLVHRCRTIIVFNVPEVNDGVFGNFANKCSSSWLYQIRKINMLMMDIAQRQSACYIVDLAHLSADVGIDTAIDRRLQASSDLHLSLRFLPLVAKNTLDVMLAVDGRIAKCLILDLDNTIWGGILGEDGPAGIHLDAYGLGAPYKELQRWAKSLSERGVLIAVASKNDEMTVFDMFDHHPDMVLRRADIAAFEVGWHDKVQSLTRIQTELGINLDNMVFLDDDPTERHRIRTFLPQVRVPDLPDDPSDVLSFLFKQNLFETAALSDADNQRTALYRDERRRRRAVHSSGLTEAEFLRDLGMAATIEAPTEIAIARVAQLSQRANQFNVTGTRLTEAEATRIAHSPHHDIVIISLTDRFGDYGIVGALMASRRHNTDEIIEHWVMSCRALQRGVEDVMLDIFVERARRRETQYVIGEYIPTAKNNLVRDLYPSRNFKPFQGRWRLDIDDYRPTTTHISRC